MLYVPSDTFPLDQGEHDVIGGIATIEKLDEERFGEPFVSFVELPDHQYNLRIILEGQESLKKKFGKKKAKTNAPANMAEERRGLAKDYLMDASLAVEDMASINRLCPDVFNEGDRQSIKVMKLAIQRLMEKLR